MKKIYLMLSLLVIAAMVLVGCTTGKAVSTQYDGTKVELKNYFILPDANNNLHAYQYMGSNAVKQYDPQGGFETIIRVKNIQTGETSDLNYVYQIYQDGVKNGAELNVGNGNQAITYYLLLQPPKGTSTKMNLPFVVCLDSECAMEMKFNSGTVKI